MNFEAEKDIEGNYIPSTVKFSFSHPKLNERLCKYMKARDIQADINNEKKRTDLNDDEIATIQHTEEMINQIKLSVVDSNLIVSKGTRGLSVKIYPAE